MIPDVKVGMIEYLVMFHLYTYRCDRTLLLISKRTHVHKATNNIINMRQRIETPVPDRQPKVIDLKSILILYYVTYIIIYSCEHIILAQ